MNNLDRDLQRTLLERLAASYPEPCSASELGFTSPSDPAWKFNIQYLSEHGLVAARSASLLDGVVTANMAVATAKGLDFLEDDGGLSAVLGSVTVRFDADTLRAFIGDHVDSAPLPPQEKSRIKGWLQSAGAEGLKEATKRLVGAAIEHSPEGIRLLQNMLGQ